MTAAAEPLVVPAGYQRGIHFSAIWTMAISPYLILYFVVLVVIGGLADDQGIQQTLQFAGTSPLAFDTTIFLDGLFHVLFMVPVIGLHPILCERWPVRANLILVAGAWQMLMGFSKALITIMSFNQLGAAYLHADQALRAYLIPVASSQDGLRMALQWMDSLGVLCVWVLVSLLPGKTELPRAVRWLGWIMVAAILGLDPTFILVILLTPAWLFLLSRWMMRLVPGVEKSVQREPQPQAGF